MSLPPSGTFDTEILSQGEFKQALEDLRNAVGQVQGSAARAVRSGSHQSISGSTVTKVQLNGEIFDKGDNFDSTTNFEYIAPADGIYDVRASIGYENAPPGIEMHCRIHVNGYVENYGRLTNETASTTYDIEVTIFDTLELSEGDAVDLRAYHTNGSALDVVHSDQKTFLSIHLIGPV